MYRKLFLASPLPPLTLFGVDKAAFASLLVSVLAHSNHQTDVKIGPLFSFLPSGFYWCLGCRLLVAEFQSHPRGREGGAQWFARRDGLSW